MRQSTRSLAAAIAVIGLLFAALGCSQADQQQSEDVKLYSVERGDARRGVREPANIAVGEARNLHDLAVGLVRVGAPLEDARLVGRLVVVWHATIL